MNEGQITTDRQIGFRLREFRDRTKIKMPEVEAMTGILKETLYKWEKGTKPSDLNDYFRLKTYLDKMEDKLEDDILQHEYRKPPTMRLPLNPNLPSIPYTEGKAAAGTVIMIDNEPELIVDRFNAPCFGYIEGVVEVVGESMYPTFPAGTRVAITRLRKITLIDWDRYYYVIDANYNGSVKRLSPHSDLSIQLLSDSVNQKLYPPMIRTWNEIAAICLVKAKIFLV